jgi:hypothetical protein
VKREDRTQCTPAGLQLTGPASPRPAQHQRWQSPPARGPAGLDAYLPPDEELLARFGDAIDDRIAEIVGELLEERNSARQRRPGRYIRAVSLILAALAASALLRHSPIAFVLYLIYAELFEVGSTCLYCTSVHIITFL